MTNSDCRLAGWLVVERTLNALVAGLEVGLELLEARPSALELRVRHAYLADALAGAASVGDQQHVAETARRNATVRIGWSWLE